MTWVLPTGRRGKLLATGLTLTCLAAAWLCVLAPLLAWYDGRRSALRERELAAEHMARVAGLLPAIEHRLRADSARLAPDALLAGVSDAVAGAALQGLVRTLADRAGATLSSAEALPSQPAGGYRRIGLHVSIGAAPWPDLVRLLASIAQAKPRMLVDDLEMHAASAALPVPGGGSPPVDASLTIFAFRPDAAKARSP